MVGALGALIGLPAPEEAAAHNFMARCRRIKDPASRRRCLQQAKAHNRRHRLSTPPRCVPQAPATTCAGRCGVYANNCGTAVGCPCPPGKSCLSNGSCAQSCAGPTCPVGCLCTIPNVEGMHYCVVSSPPCSEMLQVCTSTTECPLGRHCQRTTCGSGAPWRTGAIRCARHRRRLPRSGPTAVTRHPRRGRPQGRPAFRHRHPP